MSDFLTANPYRTDLLSTPAGASDKIRSVSRQSILPPSCGLALLITALVAWPTQGRSAEVPLKLRDTVVVPHVHKGVSPEYLHKTKFMLIVCWYSFLCVL